MNSINPAISQSCTTHTPAADSAKAVPAEAKTENEIKDGIVLSAGPAPGAPLKESDLCAAGPAAEAGTAEKPSSGTVSSLASQSLATAAAAAAVSIGGPVGHVLGVTVESLKASQKDIEKGYHLPENFISGYYERRILPYLDRPTYSKTDDFLYRGMYITADELANILQNGFEVKYNTWNAVGGKGIFFSTSIREADDYIFQSTDFHKKNALGVVFKMENGDYAQIVEDPVHNATKTIYKCPGDVPSEKIVDIYLRGQYGLERLGDIIDKARKDGIESNASWVGQFDRYLMR